LAKNKSLILALNISRVLKAGVEEIFILENELMKIIYVANK